MGEKPKQELLRGKLGESLSENLARLQELYSSPVNGDVVTRPFECGEVRCALVYLQGMAGEKSIDQFVLQPLQRADTALGERPLETLRERVLTVGEAETCELVQEANRGILDGRTLLLADGLTAKDVEVSLELPEQYLLGDDPAVYAVYTIRGGTKQESTSVKVPAKISGMADLLAQSTGAQLASSGDVAPGCSAWMLAGISLGCTAAAAVVTVLVMRLVNRIRRKKL